MAKAHPLPPAERLAALRLCRSRGIGPVTYRSLLKRYGSPTAALEALPGLINQRHGKKIRICTPDEATAEMEMLDRRGGVMVFLGEPTYPLLLAQIDDPPPVLSLIGAPNIPSEALAIVGTRNASAVGQRLAHDIAVELGAAGYSIVSGLARGIDGIAHNASLNSGTVAVLAGGVDQPYPPQHRDLYKAIEAEGTIVSEVPFGQVAKAQDFPKRNRIVSGLTKATIVIEAAERSGTLITARMAAEQGRDVFAVPGSPLEPRAAGTNKLIRDGATLIRGADDVVSSLATPSLRLAEPVQPDFLAPAEQRQGGADPETLRHRLLDLISVTPVSRDHLMMQLELDPSQLSEGVLDLVLSGDVIESDGGTVMRAV